MANNGVHPKLGHLFLWPRLFQSRSAPMQRVNPAGSILEIWQSETEGSFYVCILL